MKLLVLLLSTSAAFAESAHGGHHQPSITELIVPTINFVIVFGFILFKIKKPLAKMFDDNSAKIKDLVVLASSRDREAQIKLDTYEKKVSGLDSETKSILESAKKDADDFEVKYAVEVKQTIEKMSKDATLKIESEKNSMLKMLNETLLDEVIAKAKNKISSDSNANKKTTDNLIARL